MLSKDSRVEVRMLDEVVRKRRTVAWEPREEERDIMVSLSGQILMAYIFSIP